MMLAVKLFARARDLAGAPEISVELPESARVSDLRRRLAEICPGLSPLLPRMFVAVNNAYVNDDSPIPEQAEVACFPPVSGG